MGNDHDIIKKYTEKSNYIIFQVNVVIIDLNPS